MINTQDIVTGYAKNLDGEFVDDDRPTRRETMWGWVLVCTMLVLAFCVGCLVNL